MTTFTKFEEIEAWKSAEKIVVRIYAIFKLSSASKDWAFRDQIQRAAVSIMCNIAEGFESRSDRTFYDMLRRSKGSCGEVRTLLYISQQVGYINPKDYNEIRTLCITCSSQLSNLMAHLERTREEISSRRKWGSAKN
jgi:four helix bundle protein